MKITAATPTTPERVLKERTLKMEAEHAQRSGLTFRDAEDANIRALERLASRKRKPKAPKKPRKIDTPEQLAKTGVTQRIAPARKLPPMPACGLCRQCLRCKRELRMSQLMTKAREQDPKALELVQELVAIGFAANARKDYRDALGFEIPFSRLKGFDRDRGVTAGADRVCDRSVSFMGQWR